jgi:hypothetical protein
MENGWPGLHWLFDFLVPAKAANKMLSKGRARVFISGISDGEFVCQQAFID